MIKNRNIAKDAAIAPSKILGGGMLSAGRVLYVCTATGALYDRWRESIPKGDLFLTVAAAYDQVVSGRNDCIILSPETHTLTSMLSVAKNKVHFIGGDVSGRYYGQRSKIYMADSATAADIALIKVTGQGVSFHNIKMDSASTVAASIYTFADGGEYTFVENCEIYKSTDLNVDAAAEVLCNGDSSQYFGCTIGSNVNAITATGARPCVLLDRETITGKVARDVTFKNCIFWRKAGAGGNFFIYGSGATDVERMLLIEDCKFFNTKLAAATPAQSIGMGAAQTIGYVLVVNPYSVGSATALSTTTGVFAIGPDCGADATSEGSAQMGIAIQCN